MLVGDWMQAWARRVLRVRGSGDVPDARGSRSYTYRDVFRNLIFSEDWETLTTLLLG